MHKKYFIPTMMLGLLLMTMSQIVAQNATNTQSVSSGQLTWLLIFAMIVISIVCLALTVTIFYLIKEKRTAEAGATVTTADPNKAVVVEGAKSQVKEVLPKWSWAFLQKRLTRAVPIAQEEDIDLGHDYDGIRELDNALPPWWKWGFYITIGISVIYIWYYHFATDWSSAKEYEEQMALAEAQQAAYLAQAANNVDETSATILTADADLQAGKEIYTTNCVACHGTNGEGGIGPNFADQYWIHGGDVKDLFKTIKYGVPEKGMIAWQDQLRPQEMLQVASYILQFQGTNPPNAKEPQGELYTPEGETPADSTATPADTSSTLTMQ